MPIDSLRLAILDYPLLQLENKAASQLLSDMLRVKQMNFYRTSKSYVVMDKHDMVGTHFLIYDVQDLYSPRLVAGIRTTYENRAREHGLKLPVDNYYSALSLKGKRAVDQLRQKKGDLVDCNAWFVDPTYSHSSSKLNLSEILFFALTTYLYRLGFDHFVGATNERYKASRWVAKVGYFPDDLTFVHPSVPDLHKLTAVEYFHVDWLKDCWNQYGSLLTSAYECIPNEIERQSLEDAVTDRIERISTSKAA